MDEINGYVKVEVEEDLLDYIEDYLERCDKSYEASRDWKWEDFLLPFEKTPWWKFEWFRSTPQLDYKKVSESLLGARFLSWFVEEDILSDSPMFRRVGRSNQYVRTRDLYTLISNGSEVYLNKEALKGLEECRSLRGSTLESLKLEV